MSKINRRDYLKQMGAASAILGISNLLSPSSYSAAVNEGERAVIQPVQRPKFLFAPAIDVFPSPTNLTVLFMGLMGFSNTNHGKAQVGFQRGRGNHKLQITVYKIVGGDCTEIDSFSHAELARVKTIELAVSDQPANVNYFHKPGFERKLQTDDPKDFGWVLDFEDSPLHPGKVNFTNSFSPILELSQGTFYTHQLTNSTFNLVEESAGGALVEVINQLPRLVGAAIDIPARKEAVLKFNGTAALPPLPSAANVSYEIRFMNECFDGSSHCDWPNPGHGNEEIRNDFYMHYLMFKPNDGKRFGVTLNQPRPRSPLEMCPYFTFKGNDEAPCMGAGFGAKTNF